MTLEACLFQMPRQTCLDPPTCHVTGPLAHFDVLVSLGQGQILSYIYDRRAR